MYFMQLVALSSLLLTIAHVRSYPCSCSCCFGQGCQPSPMPSLVDAQQCTDASCVAACKVRYYQCNVTPPNGQVIGKCAATTTTTTTSAPMLGGPFTCECRCCNTGSYLCTPAFIGNTNAFSCQVGTCSIACSKQYPHVCVNSQFGQTKGNCVGSISSTATLPIGTLRCGCSCQLSTGYHYYEVTTTNGCSSCITACQSIQLQCYGHQTTYCLN
ncbi:unnamed protein product [Rotaria socialis]|uniref:Uncharacterized protein n=2 Tax=Rotaria socialis TaxID=392032 RepID=A0A818YHF5_9BILA|nr:unnamed protein product [Rotaria socialis]